jgi:hypothetical protein
MKIRPCPRCQHQTLIQTGAFWACGTCRLAITTIALCAETRELRTDKIARPRA